MVYFYQCSTVQWNSLKRTLRKASVHKKELKTFLDNLEPIYRGEGDRFVAKSLAWPVANACHARAILATVMLETNSIQTEFQCCICLLQLNYCLFLLKWIDAIWHTGKFVGFVHRWEDRQWINLFWPYRLQTVQPCTYVTIWKQSLKCIRNRFGELSLFVAVIALDDPGRRFAKWKRQL